MAVISKDEIVIDLKIENQKAFDDVANKLDNLNKKAGETKGKFVDVGGTIQHFADKSLNDLSKYTKTATENLTPMSTAIKKLSDQDLKKLDDIIGNTTDEFKVLGLQVKYLRENMDKLDLNEKEFKDLAKSLDIAEQTATEFGNAIETTQVRSESLRGKLSKTREELTRMEQSGQGGTAAFRQMQVEAGKLQDEINDTKNAVRALSSDTLGLDAGIGAIRGVIAGFTAYQGILGLVGVENKDFEKTLLKINGAMAVLQGLQEITNLLQADSAARLVITNLAQKAWNLSLAGTNTLLGISVTQTGALSVAMRVLQGAIASTGIGLFVAAIAALGYQAYKTLGEIEVLNNLQKEHARINKELALITIKNLDLEREQSLVRKGGVNDLEREIELLKSKNTSLNELNAKENEALLIQINTSRERLKAISDLPGSEERRKAYNEESQELADLLNKRQVLNLTYSKQVKDIETKLKIDRAAFANDNLGIWGNEFKQRSVIAVLTYKQDLEDFKGTESQKITYAKLRYEQYLREIETIKRDIFKKSAVAPLPTLTEINDGFKAVESEFKKGAEKLVKVTLSPVDITRLSDEERAAILKVEQQGANDLIGIANLVADARIEAIDREIDAQTKKVDRFRELAEFGSAEALQIEEDRLKKLEERRKEAVESQKKIAAVQIAINQAISASQTIKAITEAFVVDPTGINAIIKSVLIGATIASSLATVANAFGALPAFKEGTDFVNGPGTETSDSITARLSKGERVVNAYQNKDLRSMGIITNKDLVEYAKLGKSVSDVKIEVPGQGKDYTENFNELVRENKMMRKKLERLEIHMGISNEGIYGMVTSMEEKQTKLNKLKA